MKIIDNQSSFSQTANILRVAAINSVGTFVLLLGKLLVVVGTVACGMRIMQVKHLLCQTILETYCTASKAEHEFVNLLRSRGIDSQPGGPALQPYLTHRPDRLHMLAESIPWKRFLGSLNVNKFGL